MTPYLLYFQEGVCLLFLLKNQEVQSINQGYQPLTPPSEATLRNCETEHELTNHVAHKKRGHT